MIDFDKKNSLKIVAREILYMFDKKWRVLLFLGPFFYIFVSKLNFRFFLDILNLSGFKEMTSITKL